MRCISKTRTKWTEQSVFRVPIATMEMERVTRFGDLLSFGATQYIFTGVSPESVYVTADHGGVEVLLRRSEVTLGFSSDTEYKLNATNCSRRVRCDSSGCAWPGWQVSSETHALDRRTKKGCQALD